MNQPTPSTTPTPGTRMTEQPGAWRDRLGTYGLGVLIGILLVYMIMQARSQARQAANQPALPAAPTPQAPAPPAR